MDGGLGGLPGYKFTMADTLFHLGAEHLTDTLRYR